MTNSPTAARRRALLLAPLAAPIPAAARARVNHDRGLAVRGFDVVCYGVEGRARRGDPGLSHHHQGAEWRFSSPEHLARFAAAPGAHLPRFGGFCAYGVSRGYLVDVDPENAWQIVDGRLVLNFSRAVHRRWQRGIAGHLARAEANWPRLSGAA